MQAGFRIKTGLAGLVLIVLAGCEEGAPGAGSFQAQYVLARDALEAGQYGPATRRYARLVEQAGPLEPRLRLEYAHALLRAERYGEASTEARALAARSTDVARSAALAVQGTADHEQGIAALEIGDRASAERFLTAAEAALAEALAAHPGLDPLGSLERRRDQIRKKLGA